LGAFRGGANLAAKWGALAIAIVPTLALIGGLAVACFMRTFGVMFLGTPRTAASQRAHEAGPAMAGGVLGGVGWCALSGLGPRSGVGSREPVLVGSLHRERTPADVLDAAQGVLRGGGLLLALAAALALLRAWLLRRREIGATETWGCGYAHP